MKFIHKKHQIFNLNRVTERKSLFLTAVAILFAFGLAFPQGEVNSLALKREIVVAGDHYYPPYEFINKKGEADGFNVELFRLIARDLNLNYTLKLLPWDQVRTKTASREIDVVLGLMISPERKKQFSFGIPHSIMTHAIFSHTSAPVKTFSELKGKRVCVQNLDLMHDLLLETPNDYQIITVASQLDALRMVENRKCDAALIGNYQGAHLIREFKIRDIIQNSAEISPRPYAMAVSKGNEQLLDALNAGLWHLKETGEYEQLRNKWFGVYEQQLIWKKILPFLIISLSFFVLLTVFIVLLRWRIRRVTAHLRQSEEKYRLLIQNQTDLVVKVDAKGRFLYVSPSYCDFFGMSEKDLLNKSFMPLVHEDDQEATKEAVANLKFPPHYVVMEQRALSAKGWRWLSWADTAIVNEKGEIIEIIGVGRDITEQKETELALKASDERLSHLLDQTTNIAMQGYNRDGKVLYWNHASTLLYGYTKQEALGSNLFDLIIPQELIEEVKTGVQKLLDSNQHGFAEELLLKHKNGHLIPVLSNHAVVQVPGKDKELFCVDIDLSKQKESEALVNAQNAKLKAIFDNGFNLFFILNTKGVITMYNNTAASFVSDFFGHDEPEGLFFNELINDTQNDSFQYSFARALSGESVYEERLILTKSASKTWFNFHLSPILNEACAVESVMIIGIDITQKKRAELLQNILFAITDAVSLTTDLNQLFVVIKSALGQLFDTTNMFIAFYDEESDVLTTLDKEDDVEGIPQWVATGTLSGMVVKEKKPLLLCESDIIAYEKEGRVNRLGRHSKSWMGAPLLDDDVVAGVIVIQSFDNPNAYDQADTEVLEFVSVQIAQVIRRQRDLINTVEAKRKAEESDKLKTSFLNNLSHEVRTPLNCIMGMSEMLASRNFSDEENEMFGNLIINNGRQLASIINDIVSMSGIEAGQESVSLLDFDLESDLGSLKRKILEDYPAAATRFEMELNIPFKPFKIRTDKAKLNEIIIKLIDNAFKFAESGPVKLKIEYKNDSLYGEVSDAGIGIEPDDCNVIFEPFRKLEKDAGKLYRGNGLGLCLSKAYVELLNGKITVNSQPGEGSVFSFNFPVEVLNEPAKVSIPVVIGQIEPNHPTFLLVEDEHSNMELLRSALKGIKANIVLAYNGLEAVKFFENGQHADIVLMDIKMPVLNGYETVKQLKEMQVNTIFIAVTAYALTGDEAVAIGSGFDDYLAKPFSRERLIEVLTKFIRLESNID